MVNGDVEAVFKFRILAGIGKDIAPRSLDVSVFAAS
jgi:hypothetical protein